MPILILLVNTALAQTPKFSVSVAGSVFFNSERHANENGDQDVYTELRVARRLGKYFEVNAAVGHQSRSFIYYAQTQNGSLIPLYLSRKYRPVAVSARLYLSEFFTEKLRLWKKPEKWDVYYQLGVATLRGSDRRDEREESFRQFGALVPYYATPFVEEYGKVYPAYLIGLQYNPGKRISIFAEGGDGALMTLQVGLSAHF